jgi:hypothetical protein
MNRSAYVLCGIFLLAGSPCVFAQQVNPRVPPPPPATTTPATPSGAPAAAPSTPAATPSPAPPAASSSQAIDPSVAPPPPYDEAPPDPPAPSGPVFDPLHAQRSLDVGTFYLKKGSYDAAIDRFIEASNYQPNLAMPWRMLGEAYEKKREYTKAVDAYNKYLRILPHAADEAKIKKTISDLEEKSARESPKKAER